jgi:hypothetical protein
METQLSMLWSAKSDTGVPGIAVFGGCGAETFAEPLQVMRNGEAGDVFNALLAELAGDTPFDAGEDFGGSAGKLALGTARQYSTAHLPRTGRPGQPLRRRGISVADQLLKSSATATLVANFVQARKVTPSSLGIAPCPTCSGAEGALEGSGGVTWGSFGLGI